MNWWTGYDHICIIRMRNLVFEWNIPMITNEIPTTCLWIKYCSSIWKTDVMLLLISACCCFHLQNLIIIFLEGVICFNPAEKPNKVSQRWIINSSRNSCLSSIPAESSTYLVEFNYNKSNNTCADHFRTCIMLVCRLCNVCCVSFQIGTLTQRTSHCYDSYWKFSVLLTSN